MHISRKSGFTLIELLVVIAIIAILSVVVIITLNPAELLRQSRDANRLSDLATMNSALNLYSTDQSTATNFSMGSASTTYVSISDPSATSTAGDQCQGLGLPALLSGYSYHCAASSTFRLTNGTGWIPVNLANITSGSPIGVLPVDSINATSSNLFYTYTTDGTKFVLTAIFESQKYKAQYASNPPILGYPEVAAQGSNFALSELYNPNGLIGYWPMDEGGGSTTIDQSGSGNNGAWGGTGAGTSGYYSAGKVGTYAGTFDGSTNYIAVPNITVNYGSFTRAFWFNSRLYGGAVMADSPGGGTMRLFLGPNGINTGGPCSLSASYSFSAGTWNYIVETANGSSLSFYINGNLISSVACSATTTIGQTVIGAANLTPYQPFSGFLDDVRIYNRALSAAEVQALYNAEH